MGIFLHSRFARILAILRTSAPKFLWYDAQRWMVHIHPSRLDLEHPSLSELRQDLPPLRKPRNLAREPFIIEIDVQYDLSPTLCLLLQPRQPAQGVLDRRPPQAEVIEIFWVTEIPNDESDGIDFGRGNGRQHRGDIGIISQEAECHRDVPQVGQGGQQSVGATGQGFCEPLGSARWREWKT